ncbi:MAG: 3'-5' exonuclease [Desulfomonilia bacterium]|nr:3'-5' exonuclease [Deltaproteobacteria bacterium]
MKAVESRMGHEDRWVLIDTETTGLNDPVYPIEIGAQLMQGWEPSGDPFHVLINFDVPMEPDAVRIHKYTRDYLRHKGCPPQESLDRFRRFAGAMPLASYNLAFDWDRVIVPTFRRMGMPNTMQPGFCVLDLVRNLVPRLYNYRLITVLKAFGIAEKQKHHALDDIDMVIRLLREKIGPHLLSHNITSLHDVKRCAEGRLKVPPLVPSRPKPDPEALLRKLTRMRERKA